VEGIRKLIIQRGCFEGVLRSISQVEGVQKLKFNRRQAWKNGQTVAGAAGGAPQLSNKGGAPWIWDRVPDMAEKRTEILDFYHATEHLSKIAKLLHGEETQMYKDTYYRLEKELYYGKINLIIDELEKNAKHL